jgi:DDE superfamily endonuclease
MQFKLSNDPLFVDKVRDFIGLYLYLSPPNQALVLSIDEKSQIQALDREQPVLPMMPGIPERRTHRYVRHGRTLLFAALDIAKGFVIGKCYKRHRATEFFLKEIDAQVLEGLDIHIVMDNYATHKTPRLKRGLPADRIVMSTSRPLQRWINQVERWFAELTRKRLRRAVQPPSGSAKPISAHSSGTIKIPGPSSGPNLQINFWLQFNASAIKRSKHYVANFGFT